MSIIPNVTIEWELSPRIIRLPISVTEASIVDLQDTILNIEDTEEGVVFPYLRDTSGGQDLGGGTSVGWTMQLNNAQIMFAARTSALDSGAATSGDSTGKILTDSGAVFVTDGLVYRGCTIFNATTGAMAVLTEVISNTQLRHEVLSGGSRSTWLSTDAYAVYPNVQCSVTGGNLTAVDAAGNSISPIMPSPNVQTKLASSSSATNQNAAAIEFSSFSGGRGAVLDVVNGYLIADVNLAGSNMTPAKTLTEVKQIIASRGLPKTIFVIGNLTVGAAESIAGYALIGDGSVLTLTAGNVTTAAKIENMTVTGTCGGRMEMTNCYLTNIVGLCASGGDANFKNCKLMNGIQLNAAADHTFSFDQCIGSGGATAPTIDCNSCMADVDFSCYSGTLTMQNMTDASCNLSIDINSGHVTLASSVTQGNILLRGTCKYTNNTTPQVGLNIDTSGRVVDANIVSVIGDPIMAGSSKETGWGGTP